MGRRSLVLLAIALFSFGAAAAVDIGPRSVDLTGLGPCDRSASRCVAAAGSMLVWAEDFGDRTRLRAAIGAVRVELSESRVIDHLAVATDGRSYLVIWEHDDLGVDPAISAAEVAADGSVIGRATFPIDDPVADPPAGVVWNGLEYAIALPDSVVFWRNGAVARRIATPGSTGSLPAVNGNDILVVRRASKWISMLPYPYDLISRRLVPILVTNVIGSSAGPARELLILEGGNAAALAGGGDGYLLVWKDAGHVRAVRLDERGLRVHFAQVVADYDGRGGAVDAISTRDGWLVVWDDGGSLFAAELTANGEADKVVDLGAGRSPAIVKLAEGRFRVVYRTATAIESVVLSTAEAAPSRRRSVR